MRSCPRCGADLEGQPIAVFEGIECCKSHLRELESAGHLVYWKDRRPVNVYSATRSELSRIVHDNAVSLVEVRHLEWAGVFEGKWRALRRSSGYQRGTPKFYHETREDDK